MMEFRRVEGFMGARAEVSTTSPSRSSEGRENCKNKEIIDGKRI